MAIIDSFTSQQEITLAEEFLRHGYIVRDAENPEALDAIRHRAVSAACEHLRIKHPADEAKFLNSVHEILPVKKLNDLRLAVYNDLNAQSWLLPSYFSLGKGYIETLAGNELAMQRKVNVSIQMPNDASSLLEIHSDAFSGETPFQLVQWVPMVDTFDSKSMFYLPPDVNKTVASNLKQLAEKSGMDAVFDRVREDLNWISVPYGKVLIFTPIPLHGNIINREPSTRWSMNCRFTGLFTPYSSVEKTLGNFYAPITTKVVSRIGMNYKVPSGYHQ